MYVCMYVYVFVCLNRLESISRIIVYVCMCILSLCSTRCYIYRTAVMQYVVHLLFRIFVETSSETKLATSLSGSTYTAT